VGASNTHSEHSQLAQGASVDSPQLVYHIFVDENLHTVCKLELALGAQFRIQRDDNGLCLLVDEHRVSAQRESLYDPIIFLLTYL
jgi:hypothetical protein